MSFVCGRCKELVPYPQDRGEIKLEIVRARDHGKRFHSKVLGKVCRKCSDIIWPELVGEHEPQVQEALFS